MVGRNLYQAMEEKLTIVVPVYNRAHMVEATLDSIVSGMCTGFALTIVDNGSSDGSKAVCEAWAARHADRGVRIDVLEEFQPGASAARNRGLAACQTPYIYFFDSDDWFENAFVEEALRCIAAEELDMYCFPVRQDENGRVYTRAYSPDGGLSAHLLNAMIDTQCMVLRTVWLRELGGWNERLHVWLDWELGARALMAHPRMLWFTKRAFHRIRIHAESLTQARLSDTVAATSQTMDAVAEELENTAELTANEKQQARKALLLRACIMAGKLTSEGSLEGQNIYRRLAEQYGMKTGRLVRYTGKVLEWLTARGVRGAWRIACWL